MEKIFFGVTISKETKKKLKATCVAKDIKMSDAVEAALQLWWKKQATEASSDKFQPE